MAVNSESTNKEIEKQKEIGKQKDGSLVAAENDWCLNFVSNLPWADTNNALRKSGPWMTKRWFSVGICKCKPGYKSHDLL